MAKGDGRIKKGETRNPGGMTKEQRAARELIKAVLLTPERDEKWLTAYETALLERVPAIVLDYTYRRLGKPPETVNVNDGAAQRLADLSSADLLKYIDELREPVEKP